MADTYKARVLVQAEQFESDVIEYERDIERSQSELDKAKKSLRKRNTSLIGGLIIALLLTSSCSLHARELLGGMSVEDTYGLWTGMLEGLNEKAAAFGEVADYATKILLGIVNIPVGLLVFPAGLLRIIEEVLKMTFPAAVPFLAYVELAIVLFAVVLVFKEVQPLARGRAARAQARDARAELRNYREKHQEAKTQLATIISSEEYRTAYRKQQEKMDRCRKRVADAIPSDVSMAEMEQYLREDPAKAALVAELIDADISAHKLYFDSPHRVLELSPQREVGKDKASYLAYFRKQFDTSDVISLARELRDVEQRREAERRKWEREAEEEDQLLEDLMRIVEALGAGQEDQEMTGAAEGETTGVDGEISGRQGKHFS